jgi:hypothetical protein
MMVGMFSIPTVVLPVVMTIPIPPVAMEVTVMDPMISRGHYENIIRWYNHDISRDKSFSNRYPGSAVKGSLEPMTSMEAIPEASIEIKAHRVWH